MDQDKSWPIKKENILHEIRSKFVKVEDEMFIINPDFYKKCPIEKLKHISLMQQFIDILFKETKNEIK